MAQTRIFYATHAVEIEGTAMHGVQSVGIDTTFNLEQAFELGQLGLYENIEGTPDISVTMQKFLDGHPLLWHACTQFDTDGVAIVGNGFAARGDTKIKELSLHINSTDEDEFEAGGAETAEKTLNMSGMFISSCSYTIPADGNCTEDVTCVGNDKTWAAGEAELDIGPGDKPLFTAGHATNKHVIRGEDVVGGDCHIPDNIPGITTQAGGVNSGPLTTATCHMQNFTCSVDLGREEINQLGVRTPYNRYVTFPVEVTSSFEIISLYGDLIDANSTLRSNLTDHSIKIQVGAIAHKGMVIDLGSGNKLQSVSYGGGDTGGGNVSNTFNYSNFNDWEIRDSFVTS